MVVNTCNSSTQDVGWARWCMPLVSALGRQRQANFEASLVHLVFQGQTLPFLLLLLLFCFAWERWCVTVILVTWEAEVGKIIKNCPRESKRRKFGL